MCYSNDGRRWIPGLYEALMKIRGFLAKSICMKQRSELSCLIFQVLLSSGHEREPRGPRPLSKQVMTRATTRDSELGCRQPPIIIFLPQGDAQIQYPTRNPLTKPATEQQKDPYKAFMGASRGASTVCMSLYLSSRNTTTLCFLGLTAHTLNPKPTSQRPV